MNVLEQARLLSKAIKDAPESVRFNCAKAAIQGDLKAKEMIDDFHAKEFYLQQMQMMGQEIPSDKMAEMQKLDEVLMLSPQIAEYLQAERALNMLFADIFKIVGESFEMLKDLMQAKMGLG